MTGPPAENALPRVHLEYMFLTERVEEQAGDEGEGTSAEPQSSVTSLEMQESLCRSVRAYAVQSEASSAE